jgi:hypothetical protein
MKKEIGRKKEKEVLKYIAMFVGHLSTSYSV